MKAALEGEWSAQSLSLNADQIDLSEQQHHDDSIA